MSYDLSGLNNAPDFVQRKDGIYYVQVDGAEGKRSQAGNDMIAIKLVSVDDNKLVCYDRIMLSGKEGALSMSKAKLKALGYDMSRGSLSPADLNGLRCYVAVKLGKPNDEGKQYLEVDIRAKGSRCGYWDEEHPPEQRQGSGLDVMQMGDDPKDGDTPW